MSAFMISRITVRDPARFKEYLQASKKIASKYGAELILNGGYNYNITDDQADHELVVAARFPDAESIRRWHESDEYQAIVALREAGSEQHIDIYESLI